MSAAGWATIVAALIAFTGVGVGVLINQHANRVERRTKVYAESLRALRDYRELPYLIWRRANSTPDTVAELGRTQSSTLSNVRFYLNWFEIESPVVARAYRLLYELLKQNYHINKSYAWNHALVKQTKKDFGQNPAGFAELPDDAPEVILCVEAMRQDIRLHVRRAVRKGLLQELATRERDHEARDLRTRRKV